MTAYVTRRLLGLIPVLFGVSLLIFAITRLVPPPTGDPAGSLSALIFDAKYDPFRGAVMSWWIGVGLLWIAALLTLVTGWDYFRKALPHLKETP